MKMKNLLIGGMSLALVACISIGGTLAYLSDTTDTLTNTFVMENGTTIALWETADAVTSGEYKQAVKNGEAGTAAIGNAAAQQYEGTNEGIAYTDVLPGAKINKEPRLKLTDGPESYVYAKVVNPSQKQTITFNTRDWMLVKGTTNIYRYHNTVIPTAQGAWTTEIFDTVTIAPEATKLELQDITITGFAIQAKGLAGENEAAQIATADAEAIKALK